MSQFLILEAYLKIEITYYLVSFSSYVFLKMCGEYWAKQKQNAAVLLS